MNYLKYCFLFVCFVISACTLKEHIDQAKWIIGTWEYKTSEGSIYEKWVKKDSLEFQGISYKINNQDTIVLETIRIVQENGNIFYIPKVQYQNNQQAVRFNIIRLRENYMSFENPSHDFPNIISYELINNDSLIATLSTER